MRIRIAAANWKMNLSLREVIQWIADFKNKIDETNYSGSAEVIIAGAFPYLPLLVESFSDYPLVSIAAQNCHQNEKGAFTGEVSAAMLKDIGVEYVILGHSERRQLYNENSSIIKEKIDTALANGLKVIFCCGEDLETRKKDDFYTFIEYQIEDSLLHLPEDKITKCVIAYEPIWAIGTGVTALPEEAEACHAFIRKLLSSRYNNAVAQSVTILYGGSCNAGNAPSLFNQPNIDGGLIGGASLKPNEFVSIIQALDK